MSTSGCGACRIPTVQLMLVVMTLAVMSPATMTLALVVTLVQLVHHHHLQSPCVRREHGICKAASHQVYYFAVFWFSLSMYFGKSVVASSFPSQVSGCAGKHFCTCWGLAALAWSEQSTLSGARTSDLQDLCPRFVASFIFWFLDLNR